MATSTTDNSTTGKAIAHRLMLVEDDAELAESTKHYLEQHGFQVIIAKDGGQAQSTVVMRKPDFIILDLILPGESGFEICERIKQTNKDLPVLILSAIDMEDARELATRVGANGYLTKPFQFEDLLQEIETVAQKVWDQTHSKIVEDEARVRFKCNCGKRFKVSTAHRGKSLTCPDCGEPVVVPLHD